MSRTPLEQLVHFLSDIYSVEQQAIAQMVSAPKLAGEPKIAADFREHHLQTEQQAESVRQRLEAHGGSPSAIKDAVMKLGGKGFLLFARVAPETPGRLVNHAYSYEAMEWAGYEMLIRFAQHAGDQQTVTVAKTIRDQERAMMLRLERDFDAAEAVSHAELSPEEMNDHLQRHLAEVHAFESQAVQLLEKSEQLAEASSVRAVYCQALAGSQQHARWVEQRLDALGADRSRLIDAAMAAGGFNWGLFFQVQSDTPAKLAAFVYAFLHLEIGGYELLKRTARRAGDAETAQLCEKILTEKRAQADRLTTTFDDAVQATLEAVAS